MASTSNTNDPGSDRREQILRAAIQVFREKGYALTTMDAVAAVAEVSKGSLYNYFTSKQKLFVETVTDAIGCEDASFEPLLRPEISPTQKLTNLIMHWADRATHMADLARVILEAWAIGSREDPDGEVVTAYRTMYKRWHGQIAEIIAEGSRRGEFAPDLDPDLGASIYHAVIDGLLVQAVYLKLEITPQLMAGWRDGFIAALRAGKTASAEISTDKETVS